MLCWKKKKKYTLKLYLSGSFLSDHYIILAHSACTRGAIRWETRTILWGDKITPNINTPELCMIQASLLRKEVFVTTALWIKLHSSGECWVVSLIGIFQRASGKADMALGAVMTVGVAHGDSFNCSFPEEAKKPFIKNEILYTQNSYSFLSDVYPENNHRATILAWFLKNIFFKVFCVYKLSGKKQEECS